MNIIPAIDLIGGKAVRLKKGDYNEVTVYNDDPTEVAKSFERSGAPFMHIVDLDGAKDGSVANFDTIRRIVASTSLFVEVGGGIRSMDTVKKYMDIGVQRVIIGTAAVKDPAFLAEAVAAYPENISVGIDFKDCTVAIKGWKELSDFSCFDFCERMQAVGVKTVICTDISKDGMMSDTNLELYAELQKRFEMNFIASGGVSSLDDVKQLAKMDIYGAIIGKALYTGAVRLEDALTVAKEAE